MSIQGRQARPSGWVYLGRFVSGRHMSGRPTNSTFARRASRDLTDHGHASRWAHKAGWERAGWRIAATAVTAAIIYGYFTDRALTVDMVLAAMSALLLAGVIRARYAVASSRHHRRVVRPLWETSTLITSASAVHAHAHGDSHKKFIDVPRNYRTNPGARIRLTVPATWEGQPSQVKRLTDLIARRLGGEWDSVSHLSEFPPYVEFMPSPAPPSSLTFAEIIPAIERAKPGELIVGMGTHNKIVSIDLDSESPHIAVSSGSGGGKSALLRLWVIQLIQKGCERIDILDIKRVSHSWAKGIPGVYIHTTMASIMSATAGFRAEMERRYNELEHDESQTFPRWALIAEEQNALMGYARQYWQDHRGELEPAARSRVPKQNPMIADLGFILFMGRQSFMNCISVFQRFTAEAAGGASLRENYGAKVLMRYSPQTWNMLVGTKPVPRSSRTPGRARYVLGDSDVQVQMAYVRERKAKDWPGVPESEWKDEARDYALAHASAPARTAAADQSPLMRVPVGPGTGQDDEPAMTLREMVDAGLIPVRYSAATRARTRAGERFPAGQPSPVGTVYRPAAVAEWFAAHRRSPRSN
jgi:hypothetical protein